jgi:RNA polymerase sigma-70 factor (ECF subfamily)
LEDSEIFDLYWQRSEAAINETAKKYSRYCHSISFNILHNHEDAEECVNDTYSRAWNAIPPNRPNCFAVFLGKITRNLSLDKYKKHTAGKRGLGQTELALSELDECIPSASSVEQETNEKELVQLLNQFLENLPQQKRIIFVQRYWYLMPMKTIAEEAAANEGQVRTALFRIRGSLKAFLKKEGITI